MKNTYKLIFVISTVVFSNIIFSCTSNKSISCLDNLNKQQARKAKSSGYLESTMASSNVFAKIEIDDKVFISEVEVNNSIAEVTPQKVWQKPVSDNSSKVKLSKEERTAIKKSIKEKLKSKDNKETELSKGVLVILAVLLPPLAVALVDGITGPFWLSILLTLLFYVPGLVYALYRIFRNG